MRVAGQGGTQGQQAPRSTPTTVANTSNFYDIPEFDPRLHRKSISAPRRSIVFWFTSKAVHSKLVPRLRMMSNIARRELPISTPLSTPRPTIHDQNSKP